MNTAGFTEAYALEQLKGLATNLGHRVGVHAIRGWREASGGMRFEWLNDRGVRHGLTVWPRTFEEVRDAAESLWSSLRASAEPPAGIYSGAGELI